MRNLLVLFACVLLCSCGAADAGNQRDNAMPSGNTAAEKNRPNHPLADDIDALGDDVEALAARVEAAPPEDRKGAKRAEFKAEFAKLESRGAEIAKAVADSGNDDLKQYFDTEVAAMGPSLVHIDRALGLSAELNAAKAKLDIKQLADVVTALEMILVDSAKMKKLKNMKHIDKRGREFFEFALRYKLLDTDVLPKLVSLGSAKDVRSDAAFIDDEERKLDALSCSYAGPIVREFPASMAAKGAQRRVVICFNSRNWNNYPNDGVLVVWSDADFPQYMTFDEAQRDWGITRAEWDDPAGKLFGKKAPFDHTYE